MDFFLLFFLGTLFGSFSNVYFYRFTQELSFVYPNSFCPQCKSPIRWHDNVPLLSYLILKGRCRDCGQSIPWRYPLTEFLCGALFLGLYTLLKIQPWPVTAGFIFLFFILFLIGGTDLTTFFETGREYGIIPDSLVAVLLVAGLLFSWINPFIAHVGHSLAGGLFGFALCYAVRWAGEKVFKKEALGLGDVKLMGAIGVIFGWKGVFSTLMFGSLAGSAVALSLMVFRKIHRESALPFGPFLALGSLSGLFL